MMLRLRLPFRSRGARELNFIVYARVFIMREAPRHARAMCALSQRRPVRLARAHGSTEAIKIAL